MAAVRRRGHRGAASAAQRGRRRARARRAGDGAVVDGDLAGRPRRPARTAAARRGRTRRGRRGECAHPRPRRAARGRRRGGGGARPLGGAGAARGVVGGGGGGGGSGGGGPTVRGGRAAVALALWRARAPRWSRRVRAGVLVVAAGVIALLAIGALEYATRGLVGHGRTPQLASYVWQFYFKRLSFMDPSLSRGWGFRQVFIEGFYDPLRTAKVVQPAWALDVLKWGSMLGLLALVCGLAARWAVVRARAPELAILVVAVVAYLGGVHLQAYRSLLADHSDPVVTGRSLAGLLPVFGCAVAFTVWALARRSAAIVGGAVLGGAVLLQLSSLGLILVRFYA